eukprot:2949648-Ditylum_brightwellii.AAC.1
MDVFIVGNHHHGKHDNENSSSSVKFMRLDSQDDMEDNCHKVPLRHAAQGCCHMEQLSSLV